MASSAWMIIGDEVFTCEDELAFFRARHAVMIKALNETKYRYTNVPGALRAYIADQIINTDGVELDTNTQSGVMDRTNAKNKAWIAESIIKNVVLSTSTESISKNAVQNTQSSTKNVVQSPESLTNNITTDREFCTKYETSSRHVQYRQLGMADLTSTTCSRLLETLARQNNVRIL